MIPKVLTDFCTARYIPLDARQLWTIYVVSKGDLNVALRACQDFEENVKLITKDQANSIARVREAQQKAAAEQATAASTSHFIKRTPARSGASIRSELWS